MAPDPTADASTSSLQLRAAIDLLVDERAAAHARVQVQGVLRSWDVAGSVVLDAALVATELVTNALRHGGHWVRIGLRVDGDMLVVSVSDGSPVLPSPRQADHDAENGRGLTIIAAVSASWGVESGADGGKTVWAHLPLRP